MELSKLVILTTIFFSTPAFASSMTEVVDRSISQSLSDYRESNFNFDSEIEEQDLAVAEIPKQLSKKARKELLIKQTAKRDLLKLKY